MARIWTKNSNMREHFQIRSNNSAKNKIIEIYIKQKSMNHYGVSNKPPKTISYSGPTKGISVMKKNKNYEERNTRSGTVHVSLPTLLTLNTASFVKQK